MICAQDSGRRELIPILRFLDKYDIEPTLITARLTPDPYWSWPPGGLLGSISPKCVANQTMDINGAVAAEVPISLISKLYTLGHVSLPRVPLDTGYDIFGNYLQV